MAKINRGACVGILYLNAQKQKKVHNGKLLSPKTVDTAHLPKQVTIVHFTKVPNPKPTPNHKYLMKRELLTLKPLQMQKTPDLTPAKCKNSPPKAGLIEPGACIAVRFVENGVEDVKNGKFLYALVNNKMTCYINPKKPPSVIVYEHMNLVKGAFIPQTVTRTGVKEVRRIVIKPGE